MEACELAYGNTMVLRSGAKRGPWLGCSTYPKCKATKTVGKLEGADKAQAEALIPLLNEQADKAAALAAAVIGANPAAAGAAARTGPITTDIDCEDCGKPMMIRKGRKGPFLGCSGYPKCKNTGEVPAKLMDELGLNEKPGPNDKDTGPSIPLPQDHEDAA